MVKSGRLALLFMAAASCVPSRRTEGVEPGADSGPPRVLGEPAPSTTSGIEGGVRYDPHCARRLGADVDVPHVERSGDAYRLCTSQLEMESIVAMDVPTCDACVIGDCRKDWKFAICGSVVSVRIDSEWENLVAAGWSESEVSAVEYRELFGRSATRVLKSGFRQRATDLLFTHGGGWRAHFSYVAPLDCADRIDDLIEHAHVPTTFPRDKVVPPWQGP